MTKLIVIILFGVSFLMFIYHIFNCICDDYGKAYHSIIDYFKDNKKSLLIWLFIILFSIIYFTIDFKLYSNKQYIISLKWKDNYYRNHSISRITFGNIYKCRGYYIFRGEPKRGLTIFKASKTKFYKADNININEYLIKMGKMRLKQNANDNDIISLFFFGLIRPLPE